MTFDALDRFMIQHMRRWGIPLLRTALGVVFLWFGALKLAGASPVAALVGGSYSFFPVRQFMLVLGIWEVAIGLGLLSKRFLRTTLALLWIQMAGTLFSAALAPHMFFADGNIFLLTMQGEFLVKNFVLIAAGIAIGGHEVEPRPFAQERSAYEK